MSIERTVFLENFEHFYGFRRKTQLTFLMLFMILHNIQVAYSDVSCKTGYYNNSGVCTKCQDSCYTCTNGTSCTSCQNQILNSTTFLCEFCPDGKFYSSSLNSCMSCVGSCLDGCAYQLSCFQCTSSQIFDFDTMKCVSSCSTAQVQINNTQIHGLNICRTPNYYIDPNSSKILELGTIMYPFKHINLAFLEILNFLANKNLNITINLKESSTNYLSDGQSYIINAGSLVLQTYSEFSNTPGEANIYITDSSVSYFSVKTKFNIISDSTLKLSTVLSSLNLTVRESEIPTYGKTAIIVDRSSLVINNINILRDTNTDSSLNIAFIRAFYLQNNTVSISNSNFYISGWILFSEDPMNLIFQNVSIDFYSMNGGIFIDTDCNYPEAEVLNSILISNVILYNSISRVSELISGFLYYTGAANVTVESVNSTIFGTESENVNVIDIEYTSNCDPRDSIIQVFNIQNNYFTLTSNENLNKFSELYFDFRPGKCSRQLQLNYSNNRHKDIILNLYQVLLIFGSQNLDVALANNTFTNFSGQNGIIKIDLANSISFSNSSFTGSSNTGGPLLFFSDFMSSTLTGLTISNSSISLNTITHFIYLNVTEKGTISIDSLIFNDISLGVQSGIKVDGQTDNIVISNSSFGNVSIGTNSELISTGKFNFINFFGLNFSHIINQYSTDYGGYIISIDSYEVCGMMSSTINNVLVDNSSIGFIYFGRAVGQTNTPVNFNLKNITVINSIYLSKVSIFTISNIILQQDFNIIIQHLNFENLNFVKGGLLLHFTHQMKHPIVISDLSVINISNGGILIEAANKMALQFESKVVIESSQISKIKSNSESFITLLEGAYIQIFHSHVSEVTCLCEGALLTAGFQNTKADIYFSHIENIFALAAASFNIRDRSIVRMYNCSLSKNYAISQGVIYATTNSHYEIYGSIISNNYGNKISEIFDSENESIIDSTLIFSNEILDLPSIKAEFGCQCQLLCFIPPSIKIHVLSNNLLDMILPSIHLLSVIQGKFGIKNLSMIYNQNSLLSSYNSEITFDGIIFDNITLANSCIKSSSSILSISNTVIQYINGEKNAHFALVEPQSNLTINNVTFINSNCPFLRNSLSILTINLLNVKNVSSQFPLVRIQDSNGTVLTNMSFTNVASPSLRSGSLLIERSQCSLISNLTISNSILESQISGNQIALIDSNVDLIDKIYIINSTQGLLLENSNIGSISNSIFSKNGNTQSTSSMIINNSNATITSSVFSYNKAREGAAILFTCVRNCTLSIMNSEFLSNSAMNGGAIMYRFIRPIISNVTFQNNSASYGPNLASFPTNIKVNNSTSNKVVFDNIGSGQVYNSSLSMTLLDSDSQQIKINKTSDIMVIPITKNSSIKGQIVKQISDGSLIMSGIAFTASPGLKQVQYNLSTSLFSYNKVLAKYGISFSLPLVIVNFRFCMPGEYVKSNICITCPVGSYSLAWNSTKCNECMDNTNCLGGIEINVDSGYWRRSLNSTFIAQCPFKDSCLGGFNSTTTYPISCKTGYKGILCAQCKSSGEDYYERINNLYCNKCGHPFFYVLRLIAILISYIIIISYLSFLIKTKNSSRLLIIRVFINYAQFTTLIISYTTSFPEVIYIIFSPLQLFGFAAKTAFVMDCFSSDSEASIFNSSPTITTIFMILLLPIILMIICICVNICIKLFTKSKLNNLKSKSIMFLIVALFILYLSLTESGLSMFNCTQIDDGDMRATVNLDLSCYSSDHIKYAASIGAPILLLWIICFPTISYIYLSINRTQFNDTTAKEIYSFICEGLKDKKYFWEFFSFIQKFIIALAYIFIPYDKSSYKGMAAMIVLYLFYKLREVIKPYKLEIYNELESNSIRCVAFTIFSGIFFIAADTKAFWVEVIVIILVILVNCRFILFWIYMYCAVSKKSKSLIKLSILLKALLRRTKEDLFEVPKVEMTFKAVPPIISVNEQLKPKAVMKSIKFNQTSNATSLRMVKEKQKNKEKEVHLDTYKESSNGKYDKQNKGFNGLLEEDKDGIENDNTFDLSLPHINQYNKKNQFKEQIIEEDDYTLEEEEEEEYES